MARTCSECGVEPELEGALVVRRRSFSRRTATLCPRCLDRANTLQVLAACALIGGLGVVAAALGAATGSLAGLNVLLAIVLIVPAMVVHELAHALVAKLLGLRVFRVILGAGRLLFSGTPDIPLEVRAIPSGGVTLYGHRSRRFLRLRTFLVALAGPIVNGVMLWLALSLVPPGEIAGGFDARIMPVGTLAIASAFALFVNLLPLKMRSSLGPISRDGLVLLAAPFMGRRAIDAALEMRYALESATASDAGDYAAARRWAEEGLAAFPGAALLRYNLAVAAFYLGDFVEARRAFLELLEVKDLAPGLRALVQSSVAASDVRLGDPELLGEADSTSREAFGSLPWEPAVRGARGAVLVEMGSLDEGLGLLRQAADLSEDAKVAAIFACWIAIGEGRRGDRDEALRQLARARELDARCSALPRAEREVDAAAAPAPGNPPRVV